MIEAKVFQSGNSQAIRLPKDYRLDAETVKLNRIGNLVVIVPKDDPWASFKEGIKEASDFPLKDDSSLELKKVEM